MLLKRRNRLETETDIQSWKRDHSMSTLSPMRSNNITGASIGGENRSLNGGDLHKQNAEGSNSIRKAKPVSYEQFAPRSTDIRSKLAKIQALTAGPIHAPKTKTNATSTSTEKINSSSDSQGTLFLTSMAPSTDAIISTFDCETSDQKSSSSVENDPIIKSTLKTTTETSNHIAKILDSTSNLYNSLAKTTSLVQAITNRHASLLQHSSELSLSAERLQHESDQLAQHAKEIGLPLKHYDAVDRLGLQVGVLFKNGMIVKGLAKIKVDDGEFLSVLNDVDEAVGFFADRSEISIAQQQQQQQQNGQEDPNLKKSQEGSGSIEYFKRSLALQEACMDLFKDAIVDRISQTSSQIHNALDLKRKTVNGDTLEASLIYTRFHGISSRSNYLLNIVKKKMNEGNVMVPSSKSHRISQSQADMICPYTEIWNVCRNTYIQNRLGLLNMSIRSHLDFLKDKHGLIGMARLASVFLMRLCTAETSLYLDFFGTKTEENKDDQSETISEKEAKKDSLEETNETNGSGINLNTRTKKDAASLASQVMSKDGTYYDNEFQSFLDNLCNNLHRTIRRGLVSIMELDTLCQVVSVLREERSLANASPVTMAAARSLGRVIVDAQERLIFCANGVLGKEVIRFKATPVDLDYPDKLRKYKEEPDEGKEGESNKPSSSDNALMLQMRIYESWFPPIRSVLKVLSKLFRVVEPQVFEDIALSSVQSCARSLKEGSAYIERKNGQLHSDLFLVKHLLVSSMN